MKERGIGRTYLSCSSRRRGERDPRHWHTWVPGLHGISRDHCPYLAQPRHNALFVASFSNRDARLARPTISTYY